jgi:hypothetical protein
VDGFYYGSSGFDDNVINGSNFTINDVYGMYAYGIGSRNTVLNSNATGTRNGFYISGNNNTVINCHVNMSSHSIHVYNSQNNRIINGSFVGQKLSTGYYDIQVYGASKNNVFNGTEWGERKPTFTGYTTTKYNWLTFANLTNLSMSWSGADALVNVTIKSFDHYNVTWNMTFNFGGVPMLVNFSNLRPNTLYMFYNHSINTKNFTSDANGKIELINYTMNATDKGYSLINFTFAVPPTTTTTTTTTTTLPKFVNNAVNAHCVNSTTLENNYTYNGDTIAFRAECPNGCDSVLNSCKPPTIVSLMASVGLSIIIILLLAL